jgi:hypothetical protein
MGLAIGLQVTGVFRQPVLEPIVILLEVFRVLPAPVDQILDFQCPLAVWSPTTLLAILHPGIGDKEIITKSASLFSHLAPPGMKRNKPVQRDYRTKMIQKNRIKFLYWGKADELEGGIINRW